MIELNIVDIFSYTANIVFVTWGVVSIWKDRVRNKQLANLFNSAYEMSEKLVRSLEEKHSKAQAEDISSFLKSATRNLMNRRFDRVGGESHNFFCRLFEKYLNKNKKVK